VNVSVEELRSPEYPDSFRRVLEESWPSPEQLVVEVTEAVFDAGDDQVARSLMRIRELGVRIAIDDFGTGYSSMRWLDRFPLDILKIDASFVRSITHEDQHMPILEAMIAMGRALGLTVLAEGVETQSQAAVLRRLGCELAQGYLFGRPAPLADHVVV
jgi:EAL domain-containing protein (putative c-di-GMP-specific phosphodiesterase class I)